MSHTSKMLKENLITLVLMHKQPPMMSRVCQCNDVGVRVSAEFISDSRAAGCLLVFEETSTSSPDIFRAVHRPQLEQGYTVALPLSTYTVYGYDIEEDELPNCCTGQTNTHPLHQ